MNHYYIPAIFDYIMNYDIFIGIVYAYASDLFKIQKKFSRIIYLNIGLTVWWD